MELKIDLDKALEAFNKKHDESDSRLDKYWSYDSGTSVTNFIKFCKDEFINKPVETTNEQPKKDLKILYKDQKNIQYPILYEREYGLEVQLTGMSISLRNDGTFFINDTTGG